MNLAKIITQINDLGTNPGDSALQRTDKNLLVYLALFMSVGGLIWGSLLLSFDLLIAALIPYAYVVFSFFNIIHFYKARNFGLSRSIQLTLSLLLPFFLQALLGGFIASGAVMVWSMLALIGSITLVRGNRAYILLFMFVVMVIGWFWLDPLFVNQKPAVVTQTISLWFLVINVLLVLSIFFLLAKLKVDRDILAHQELHEAIRERDHTQKSESEATVKLNISEIRYRNLVEESKVLICTHDLNGVLLTVNKPGAAILGYYPEELIGKTLAHLIPKEFYADYEFYLEHIAKIRNFEGFMTIITKDGSKRIFLFKNTLIREGNEKYVLGSAQDVTEWRKSEFRQQKIKAEQQLLISSIDDFVIEFNAQARFKNIWCRDESKLFMPISSFIGKTISESFPHAPEFAVAAERLYQEALQTGERKSIEIEDIFSLTPLFYLARLNPIKNETGVFDRCTALVTNITEQKLAEIKLTEAIQTQSVLFDNLEGAVMLEDTSGRIVAANQKYCDVFSLEPNPQQLVGVYSSTIAARSSHLFVDANRYSARISQALEAREKILNERIFMTDGRVWERDFTPILSGHRFLGYLWNYRDVTARLQAETELKKTKEFLARTNEVAMVGGWEVDFKNNTSFMTDTTKKIHELDADFIPDVKNAFNFFKEGESRDLVTQMVKRAITTGESYDIEFQLITSKGKEIWVRSIGHAEFENGKCAKLYGTLQDIDKLKRNEFKIQSLLSQQQEDNKMLQEMTDKIQYSNSELNASRKELMANLEEVTKLRDNLIESERTLRRAQEIGKVGNWAMDKNKSFTWSEEVYRIWEIPKGELITFDDYLALIHPDDRARVIDAWAIAMKSLDSDIKWIEYRVVVKGAIKWMKASGQFEFDSDGNFLQTSGILKDISAYKFFEESLRKAKEEAENANQLKTIFMGNLSHEVRTPLQGIQGFAEILENSNISDEDRKKYLTIIKNRTHDLQNIIDSLLDMASLETGEFKSFPKLINLHELIETTFISIHQDKMHQQKHLDLLLENNLSPSSTVIIDATHLKQVIINLMRNGLKFTNHGFVKLSASEQNSQFIVTVADSGIGVPIERQKDIFVAFRQAHEGLSRSKGGIGLGLSICKKMVDMWGGSIGVVSEAGKGSQFSFSIPK